MIRNLLSAVFFLTSICSQAQTDSVFFIGKSTPTLGNALINYKKQIVSVSSSGKGSIELRFEDISSVKSANGKSYIQHKVNGLPQLLVVLVQGKYGLLYDDQNKLFFVIQDNLLKVISRDHIKRALPLIFGDELMDQFYQKTNITPSYSSKYLVKITSFINEFSGSTYVVNQQNLGQFKTSVYIGPYLAVGKYTTIFDMAYLKLHSTYYEFRKTKSYSGNSMPFGLQIDVTFSPRISLKMSSFINKTSLENVFVDSIGFYKLTGKPSILEPEKFDPDLKWNGYSYKTVNFDLNLNYSLTKNKAKFQPYIFAGPSVVIMTQNEIIISATYLIDLNTESNINRWTRSKRSEYMIAFNGGFGFNYKVKKRILIGISAKFQAGNFPKVSEFRTQVREENNTPIESNAFADFTTPFSHRIDQHSKLLSINGSFLFRL